MFYCSSACSFIFGAGGALVFILLLSIGLNFIFGLLVDHSLTTGDNRLKRLGITLSVLSNVAILGYFKYANFVIDNLNALAASLGWGAIAWDSVILPIGISFYTFQSMSYVIDVARKDARVLRNPIDFALYVSMFPQLIAGPIVRYHLVAEQLRERTTRFDDYVEGVQRFCLGLVKKVVIADSVGQIAEAAFATPTDDLSMLAAWCGILAYTLQIYFDFSAYSDMAIGLGRILGFRFPENFNRPYSAESVTDFWRRWHMTLSNWFRDYVYIPLGGNRGGEARTFANLWIVFFVTGLWHGANWTFIIWGLYHGALLVLERVSGTRLVSGHAWIWRRALTLFLVMMGWVIFRAANLDYALGYYAALLSFDMQPFTYEFANAMTNKNTLIMILASAVFLLPKDFNAWRILEMQNARFWHVVYRYVMLLLALPYALILVISGSFTAFIYFQF